MVSIMINLNNQILLFEEKITKICERDGNFLL